MEEYIMKNMSVIAILLLVSIGQAAYNQPYAIRAASYAAIAYCSKASLTDWSCEECSKVPPLMDVQVIFNEAKKVQVYVGADPDSTVTYVVARGIVLLNVKNLISMLQLGEYSYNYYGCEECNVQTGFFHQYFAIKDDVIAAIKNTQTLHPDNQIVLVGHGIGGAIVNFIAADLVHLLIPAAEIITFGSPRTGNTNFRKWWMKFVKGNRSSYQITHGRDPLVHFPPLNPLTSTQKYNRVGQQIYYQGAVKEKFRECTDIDAEDPNCSNSITFALSLEDHIVYMDLNFCTVWRNCR